MQKVVHAIIAITPIGIVRSINQPIVKNALKMVPKGIPNRLQGSVPPSLMFHSRQLPKNPANIAKIIGLKANKTIIKYTNGM